MLRNSTIRSVFSGLMLLIFAFSITPKIVLHDLVVNHKDASRPASSKNDQVSQSGFHCDCESQVVVLPFIAQVAGIYFTCTAGFQVYQSRSYYSFYSGPHFIYGLRGPPLFA